METMRPAGAEQDLWQRASEKEGTDHSTEAPVDPAEDPSGADALIAGTARLIPGEQATERAAAGAAEVAGELAQHAARNAVLHLPEEQPQGRESPRKPSLPQVQ